MKRRAFLYSSNLLLIVVLVMGITVVANILLSRHHKRFDFTSARLHSISDASIPVVTALKTDVSIKAFFRETNMGRGRLEDVLKLYAYHLPRIKTEFIDPDKNPGLVKRYESRSDGTTILEAGDKETRTEGLSEEDVTNALIKVTREKTKTVCFLEGHGEISPEIEGDDGASIARAALKKMSYEIRTQTLALPGTLPKDCDALVIAGPKKDLLPAEREALTAFLKEGGRILFLLDAFAAPGLAPFLAGYGFKLENDILVDPASGSSGRFFHAVRRAIRAPRDHPGFSICRSSSSRPDRRRDLPPAGHHPTFTILGGQAKGPCQTGFHPQRKDDPQGH
jgi:ABC-type uncharacterized transport system involved in gliding motility auxiliary subunit